ncbi:hypothetical protein ACLOJK_011224 [Asimina triloba]
MGQSVLSFHIVMFKQKSSEIPSATRSRFCSNGPPATTAEAAAIATVPDAISSHPRLCSSIIGVGPSTPVRPLRPSQTLAALASLPTSYRHPASRGRCPQAIRPAARKFVRPDPPAASLPDLKKTMARRSVDATRCSPSVSRRPSPAVRRCTIVRWSLPLGKKVKHHITVLQRHKYFGVPSTSFGTPAVHAMWCTLGSIFVLVLPHLPPRWTSVSGPHISQSTDDISSGSHISQSADDISSGLHINQSIDDISSGPHINQSVSDISSGLHISQSIDDISSGPHINQSVDDISSGPHISQSVGDISSGPHISQSQWAPHQTVSRRQSAVGFIPHQLISNGPHISQSVDDISSGPHISQSVDDISSKPHISQSVDDISSGPHISQSSTFGVFWRFKAQLLSLYISGTPFRGCAYFG